MLKIFRYFGKKDWAQAFVGLVLIIIQVWLELKLPDYMSEITVLVQTPGSPTGEIWRAGGYMLICALGGLACSVVVGYFAAVVASSFSRTLRRELFEKVDAFSVEEINLFSTSSLITRSTNDVMQLQMAVTMGLQMVIRSPIMAVWALGKIAGKGFEWTLATGVAIVVLVGVILTLMTFVMPVFRSMQTLTDNLTRVTRENLTGLRVVRAYNAEEFQQTKFEAANGDLTNAHLFASRSMAVMMPTMQLVMSGLTLSIYWIGAYLINGAGMVQRLTLFSNMVVFSAYAMQVIMSFMMMAMLFMFLPRAAVSANRIIEVLDTEPSITDGTATDGLPGLVGEVEFRHVSFKYPDAADYVLHDVSFSVKKGESIAFIGSTGSGKSTLINLVPRFFDATEGEVLVDGVNVKDYKQEALYNKIGYVPQRAVMFRGTVRSNVGYGDNGKGDFPEEAVREAVKIAQGSEFVEAMEGGYGAKISQGGSNLSGGQRQRLAIARAVCRDPEIYIFDDAFSALDYKTDRALRNGLKKQTAGVTSMIVAQRIGTIADADKIVVLDEGRVVGTGKHKELLRSCDVYREIAMSQLSREELENE